MINRLQNLSGIFFLTLLVALSSCSFNGLFLKPHKFPDADYTYTIKTPVDTFKIYYTGKKHQPTFTKKNGRDTVESNYTVESVLFKNTNGDTLNGWFLKPINQKASITMFHLHGNSGSLFNQYRIIAPLAKNGFQAFIFDYSGFGFSKGKATRKNTLIDALSALDYLKTREEVKNTKIILYGQSYGGHLAPVVAAQRPNDIDGLIIEGAFSTPKDIAASRVPILGRLLVRQMYSANTSIKNFHKSVLVIHSTEDDVVPFKMGQKLFKSANPPKEFYEIKECHICGPMYYTNEISEKIRAMATH